LSDAFPIQNYLKQDALSTLHFNFTLEYITSNIQENQGSWNEYGHISHTDDTNLTEQNPDFPIILV
jgi:hypothetical protein